LGHSVRYGMFNRRLPSQQQLALSHPDKLQRDLFLAIPSFVTAAISLSVIGRNLRRTMRRTMRRVAQQQAQIAIPTIQDMQSTSSTPQDMGKWISGVRGGRWLPPKHETSEPENCGFIFLKPHANTKAGQKLLRDQLKKYSVEISKEESIDASEIKRRRIIDDHYGSIASKAVDISPADLQVQPKAQQAFEAAFGITWCDALARNIVFNAAQAKDRLKVSDVGLDDKWTPLQLGKGKVKFGSGCYCGRIDDIFVINGFYMAMQSMYLEPHASVHCFIVKWRACDLSWVKFREDVLGATDPAHASATSLRGLFFQDWKNLGLEREPWTGENAVHASASPFEAFLERRNWLDMPLAEDTFGTRLLDAGISQEMLQQWASDPVVSFDGKTQSVFDHFENLDAGNCVALAQSMSRGHN